MDAATVANLPREERIETLPDVPGTVIDEIPKDDRLAPEPDIDYTEIEARAKENGTSVIRELGEALKGLPRSQRVQIAFDFRPTDYQAVLLDYAGMVDRAQAAPQKGRQTGATTIAGVIGADHVLCNAGVDVLYTAPGQDTADEMFSEFKDAFKDGPFTLEQYGVKKDNEREWKFAQGSRALSRTLGNVNEENNSGNRGFSPTCVIVDEAAYTYDAVFDDELEPFFITHPEYEYYLFSTPAGESGYYYERVKEDGHRDPHDAAAEDFGWFAPYWPTKVSPFAQQDFIEKQRKKKDESTFAREYLGKFEPDGDSAIPHDVLVPNIKPDQSGDPSVARYLGIDPARSGNDEMIAFDMDADGVWRNIWAFKTISGPQFLEFLEVVHQQKPEDELEYWNGPPEPAVGRGVGPSDGYHTILIEENGVGGFGADFAEAGLGSVVKVVTSSNETKQNIYGRLINDLESEELALPNHRPLIRQTTKLQKTFTPTGKAKYEAPPGKHDDYPDGMAFANWARHGHGDELDTGGPDRTVTKRRRGGDRGRRMIRRA